MATPTPEDLTTAQVAEMAGVHGSVVSRAVERGELEPCFRAPGTRGAMWFRRDDVLAWLRSRLEQHIPPGLAGIVELAPVANGSHPS